MEVQEILLQLETMTRYPELKGVFPIKQGQSFAEREHRRYHLCEIVRAVEQQAEKAKQRALRASQAAHWQGQYDEARAAISRAWIDSADCLVLKALRYEIEEQHYRVEELLDYAGRQFEIAGAITRHEVTYNEAVRLERRSATTGEIIAQKLRNAD